MKHYLTALVFAVAFAQPATAVTFPSLTTIYVGSGVRDNSGTNTIATAFLCTNVSGVAASVRVLVLFSDGDVAGSNVASVPHGATRTVVTNTIGSSNSSAILATTAIGQGGVNIESTQSAVFCNALIMHRTDHASGVPLRLVRINSHPGSEE